VKAPIKRGVFMPDDIETGQQPCLPLAGSLQIMPRAMEWIHQAR
jgi:hypothetical protein